MKRRVKNVISVIKIRTRLLVQISAVIFFLTCLLENPAYSASSVVVTAKVDTTQIRIGEQFHLELTATVPTGGTLGFPLIPDSLKGLEVVKRNQIDTIKSEDGKSLTYHQLLQLTAFDSGYYVIEPLPFTFREHSSQVTDTLLTEAQLITVFTVSVDTTQDIKDIKATLDVPITWRDWLPYVIGAWIAILVIILVIRLIKKRKQKSLFSFTKKPARPAHEIALEELKKTEEAKLWQQGFFKKYHTAISDIIRTYIEHRFDIRAMELTTDEIMHKFHGTLLINEEAKEKLRHTLELADLVKFAKLLPVANENELSMMQAYSFIALTKPVDIKDFTEEKKEVAV